jgi:peptide/nickel transport system permease protein
MKDTILGLFFRRPGNWFWMLAGLGIIIVAVFGWQLAPYGPLEVNMKDKFLPPVTASQTNLQGAGAGRPLHWMGTDNLGRDMLSRVMAGAGLALLSGVIILSSAVVVGSTIGLVSGFYGGAVDEILMRISDIFIAFPGLVLALAISAALGPNLVNAMIAIACVWWPPYARLVRGQVLALRQREFIEAAYSLGAGSAWILWRHVLPNILTPLIVQVTSDVGPALVTSSSLSFIGMGAQPPTPEWGSMVSQGRKYLLDYWWISTFPGAAIFATVWVFNGVGEAVRKAL